MMKKDKLYYVILFILLSLLLFLSLPKGYIFGSYTDWYSQHVSIADHIRNTIFETKNLFPDYSSLGGGSNMFMFAYYGILRLDVLIGCLFPTVSMQTIIIIYSIVGIYISMFLCFYWLRKNKVELWISFVSSILFVCSTCFFQAHRQIMFVSYMPFMLLLLISIDYFVIHKKKTGIILSLFFLLTHNYFFVVSYFVVGLLYALYKKMDIKHYIGSFVLASMLAMVLLLPTGLTILEHSKDAGTMYYSFLLGIDVTLRNILYSPYGCGMTIIALYSLIINIKDKEYKILALPMTILIFFNICSYVLNGGLYIRGKVFMPFLPLLIFICAVTLEKMRHKKINKNILILLFISLFYIFQEDKLLFVIDLLVVAGFLVLVERKAKIKSSYYLLLCIIPFLLTIDTNRKEEYVLQDDARQSRFTSEELSDFYQDSSYRFDFINAPLTNANYHAVTDIKKTTMYSSTMNTLYSNYYYDVMKMPIGINNRVALLANDNPFIMHMLSVRYLQTTKGKVPYGYEVVNQNGDFVLCENTDVLPMAYVSSNLISEKEFDNIAFPYYLDVINNYSVVKKVGVANAVSNIQPMTQAFDVSSLLQGNDITKVGNKYLVTLKEKKKVTIPLTESLENKMLIISFDVESVKGHGVEIEINQIGNKLSSVFSSYPNRNNHFVYMLSSNEEIEALQIEFSKGNYHISDVIIYTLEMNSFNRTKIQPLELEDTNKDEVIKGTVFNEHEGYFVTSLPYQKGYHAYVDGKEVPVEIVNKAFLGFPLDEGAHDIVITFNAPGKKIGMYISIFSCGMLVYCFLNERRKKYE